MLTVSTLFRRTASHCNRAGTTLSLYIVGIVLLSLACSVVGQHLFVRSVLSAAREEWGEGIGKSMREEGRMPLPGEPAELEKARAGLKAAVAEYLQQKDPGKTPVQAAQSADAQVTALLSEQFLLSLPWMTVIFLFYVLWSFPARGMMAAIAADSTLSVGRALRRGLGVCIPLMGLEIMLGAIVCSFLLLMLLMGSTAHSLMILGFIIAVAVAGTVLLLARLCCAQAFLVQDGLGIRQSIRRSWQVTEGRTPRVAGVFLLIMACFLVAMLCGQFFLLFVAETAERYSPYAGYVRHLLTFVGAVGGAVWTVAVYRMKELLAAEKR